MTLLSKFSPCSHQRHILDFLYNQLYLFDFNTIRIGNLDSFNTDLTHFFNILSSQFNNLSYKDDYDILLHRFICLTVFIRNKHHGKGQKLQFYAMIFSLYQFNPSISLQLIESIWVSAIQNNIHIGSFRDFKHLCMYVFSITQNNRHPFIEQCCKLYIKLLCKHNDYFMAKWSPREHSKYQWIFNKLTYYYAKTISKNITSYKYKKNKYKKSFRRFVSSLCTHKLETNMCLNKKPFFIPYPQVLSYKHHFIQTPHSHIQPPHSHIQPLSSYHNFSSSAFEPGKLFKHLYKLLDYNTTLNYDSNFEKKYNSILSHFNSVWQMNIDKCSKFMDKNDFILFVDVGSLNFNDDDNSMYDMIGMALFSMHFSKAHKRILFASNNPHWINFTHCNTFVECVIYLKQHINNMCWYTSCEMTSAISTLLQAFQITQQSTNNIYNVDLVFIHGNKNGFTHRCIDSVKYFKPFFNKFIFWNFCKSHYIKDIDEINNFEKDYSFISGNNVNVLFDIINTTHLLERFLHKIRKRHYLTLDGFF